MIPSTYKHILIFFFPVLLKLDIQAEIIFKNAQIHQGNGALINNAVLVIENEKIVYVGTPEGFSNPSKDAKTIDLKGNHIYPGLISLYSSIGLVEIDAVRASDDTREIGENNAQLESCIAYNVDSDIIPTVRSNGILIAQVTPKGSFIAGQSSAMFLSGWTMEESLIKKNEGLHINWPSSYAFGSPSDEYSKNQKEKIETLKTFLTEAKAYAVQPTTNKNHNLEAAKGLFDGSKTLYINVAFNKDIIQAVQLLKELNVAKIVVVGSLEPHKISSFLKKNNISVVLGRVHSTPYKDEADIDLPFKLPYLLTKDSVTTALSYDGEMEAQHSKNLSFTAGTTVAYGLAKEEALKLITLNSAKILNIDKEFGSLERGKNACFIISEGDIFEMKSSNVQSAYISGKEIELDNKHKALERKYKEKYKLK